MLHICEIKKVSVKKSNLYGRIRFCISYAKWRRGYSYCYKSG